MSRLGELLLKHKSITPDQLLEAIERQRREGGVLAESLVELGLVDEEGLIQQLHAEYRLPMVDPLELQPTAEALQLIPHDLANKHCVLPVKVEGTTITIATTDPSNHVAFNEIRFVTGCNVKVVIAGTRSLKRALSRFYDQTARLYTEALDQLEIADFHDEEQVNVGELQRQTQDAPIVKLVNTLLSDAVSKRASDVHIEPYEKDLRVRFRIDGVLHDIMQPPRAYKDALASRIKILAKLDIAQRRLPQDGVMKLRIPNGPDVNFRVSVLPMVFGEKVVLRLLQAGNLQADLTKLGLEPHQLEHVQNAIAKPYGMLLVTGPTGSGKSTTLYSALTELNNSERNISTAEDPVEYYIRGINQVQVADAIGLSFAAALRSFLRQDPDVIMVGEIRDGETAEIAIKAALTGHLVLSTLHTNDAPSTINRILNMGVEPFLIASSLNVIIAQRLARLICRECKAPTEIHSRDSLLEVGFAVEEIDGLVVHQGKGCDECSRTGYRGRVALYETMPIGERLREMIIDRASSDDLKRAAIEDGLQTLRRSGLNKVREGLTTIEEVLRVSSLD